MRYKFALTTCFFKNKFGKGKKKLERQKGNWESLKTQNPVQGTKANKY